MTLYRRFSDSLAGGARALLDRFLWEVGFSVDNERCPASLEKRKIYVALRDTDAEKTGLLRIIDPKTLFRSIAQPLAVRRVVLANSVSAPDDTAKISTYGGTRMKDKSSSKHDD